tara:strand:+ start:993 stop:1886 length:894 start_codon:yes stop_codon:yes gene_type:complete
MAKYLLILGLFFTHSCNEKPNHIEFVSLKKTIDSLKKNNKLLSIEKKKLKSELINANSKLDSLAGLPTSLFLNTYTLMQDNNYLRSKVELKNIMNKFPAWEKDKVLERYQLVEKLINEEKKELNRKKREKTRKEKSEKRLLEQLANNVELKQEKDNSIYTSKRNTFCKVTHTVSFSIQPSIVVDGINKFFMIKFIYIDKSGSGYHNPEWMDFKGIKFIADNGTLMALDIDKSMKIFDETDSYKKETAHIQIDNDILLKFHDSNRIRIYFTGKYLYEFDMVYDQFYSFKEIIAKFDRI